MQRGEKQFRSWYFTCWRAREVLRRWQQEPRIRPKWRRAPFRQKMKRRINNSNKNHTAGTSQQIILNKTFYCRAVVFKVVQWMRVVLKISGLHDKPVNIRFHRTPWMWGRRLGLRSVPVQGVTVSDLQRSGAGRLSDDPLSVILVLYQHHRLVCVVQTSSRVWTERTVY